MIEIDKNNIPNLICVYLLICVINGKKYVGKSIVLKERMNRHKNGKKQIIDRAIQKYGWSNFKLIILHDWEHLPEDEHEIDAVEVAFIDDEKSMIKDGGYNVSLFGLNQIGVHPSQETRLKMSLSRKGRFCGSSHPMYGKKIPCTEERKRFLSKAYSGVSNPTFDKKTYIFFNKNTKEEFVGHKFDLRKRYNLGAGNLCEMMKGKRKSCGGWILSSIASNPSFIRE